MPYRDPFEGLNLPAIQQRRVYNPAAETPYGGRPQRQMPQASYADPYGYGGMKYQPRQAPGPSYDPYSVGGAKYAPRTAAPPAQDPYAVGGQKYAPRTTGAAYERPVVDPYNLNPRR